MIQLLKKHKENLKNAGLIISGIVLGKGVAIVLTLFLTQIYSPESFGVLAIFMSSGSLFSAIFTLKYEISILNTTKDSHEASIKFLKTNAFYSAFILNIVFIVLYLFNLIDLVYCFVPVYAFIISLYEVSRMQKVFQQNFKIISASEAVRNSVGSVVPLAKYFTGVFPGGLMVGELFSKIVAIRVFGVKKILSFQSFALWKITFKKEIKNMLKTGGSSIINISSSESLMLVTGAIYGPQLAGLFFISRRIVAVPIGLITTALGDIINSNLSKIFIKEKNSAQVKKVVFKSLILLVSLASLVSVIMFFSIDFIVNTFLAKEFLEVSKIVKYSMAFYFSLIIIRPISSYFNIIKQYKYNLIWDIIRFSILASFYLIAILFNFEFYVFIFWLSICLFVGYILYPIMIKFIKEPFNI